MIGIIGAMDVEVVEILKYLVDVEVVEILNTKFYQGKIADKSVVVVKSGVGKTLSAMTTTLLVNNFDLTAVINIGSAGALVKDLNVLDVVVSEKVAISDYDITAFGHQRNFAADYLSFKSDAKLLNIAKSLKITNVVFGNMTSSDSFISRQQQVKAILTNFESSLCADMEAGSIAMVLNQFKIPFIVIRSISDNVVKSVDNTLEFNEYLKLASRNSAKITKAVIAKIQ